MLRSYGDHGHLILLYLSCFALLLLLLISCGNILFVKTCSSVLFTFFS